MFNDESKITHETSYRREKHINDQLRGLINEYIGPVSWSDALVIVNKEYEKIISVAVIEFKNEQEGELKYFVIGELTKFVFDNKRRDILETICNWARSHKINLFISFDSDYMYIESMKECLLEYGFLLDESLCNNQKIILRRLWNYYESKTYTHTVDCCWSINNKDTW